MKKLKNGFLPNEYSYMDCTLKGFTDTHIHTSPDVISRIQTDVEAALSAKKEHMHTIVLKSHHEPTAGRAVIASEVTGFPVCGGVVLNSHVGGLNQFAVEASARIGGKFVWFPTISYPTTQMDWAKIENILHIVSEKQMVIGTGHLKPEDIFHLIDMAKSFGIWRIIVNHPLTRVVGASIDDQVEMSKHAYLEHCFVACMERHDNLDPGLISDSIKKIGADRCLMATDFGQIHNPNPVNGLKMFIDSMISRGISINEITTMCRDNPKKLIKC
jgi:hypothetical protein